MLGKALGRKGMAAIATIGRPRRSWRFTESWWPRSTTAARSGDGAAEDRGRHRASIVKMASQNSWGYTRIKGALKNLGRDVGRNTIGGLKPTTQHLAEVNDSTEVCMRRWGDGQESI